MSRRYRYQPNRNNIIVEQIIDRHIRQLVNEQRLDEGKFNTALTAFKAAYTTIKAYDNNAHLLPKIITVLTQLDFGKIPSLIGKSVKVVDSGAHGMQGGIRYMSLLSNTRTYKTAEASAVIMFDGTPYSVPKNDAELIKLSFDLFNLIWNAMTLLFRCIPGIGSVGAAILDLLKAILTNISKSFDNEMERIWQIACDFFKSQLPFTFDDLKAAWGWVSNATSYGGDVGVARKKAAHTLYTELRPRVINMLRNESLVYLANLWNEVSDEACQKTYNALVQLTQVEFPKPKDTDVIQGGGVITAYDNGDLANFYFKRLDYKVLDDNNQIYPFWPCALKFAKQFESCGYNVNRWITMLSRNAAENHGSVVAAKKEYLNVPAQYRETKRKEYGNLYGRAFSLYMNHYNDIILGGTNLASTLPPAAAGGALGAVGGVVGG